MGAGGARGIGEGEVKNLLIALMLVIMGQRWESIGEGFWISPICQPSSNGVTAICIDPPNYYRLVYVIGEFKSWMFCQGMGPCGDFTEKFTIPVPNTPTKAMTKDEAEKANKELMK